MVDAFAITPTPHISSRPFYSMQQPTGTTVAPLPLAGWRRIPRVAVIGAGVIGLSVAMRIKEVYNDAVHVTIVAEKFGADTTSFNCGGLWEPYKVGNTDLDLINAWGRYSYQHFMRLANQADAAQSGCQMITAYHFYEHDLTSPSQLPPWRDIPASFAQLTSSDISAMGLKPKYLSGHVHLSVVADQSRYMPYLERKLRDAGVVFQQRRVDSLAAECRARKKIRDAPDGGATGTVVGLSSTVESSKPEPLYDVLINCTGLGAADIVSDDSDSGSGSVSAGPSDRCGEGKRCSYPIRGQVLRLKAPWLKHVLNFEPDYYVIPQSSGTVVAGGTAQVGDWSTALSETDSGAIMGGLREVLPAIQGAEVVSIVMLRVVHGCCLLCTTVRAGSTALFCAAGESVGGAATGSLKGAPADGAVRWWCEWGRRGQGSARDTLLRPRRRGGHIVRRVCRALGEGTFGRGLGAR